MIKTKKEAKERGLRTAEEWLKKDRVVVDPANGFNVRDNIYYELVATEQLLSAKGKPGYKVKPGAEPIKQKKSYQNSFYFNLYKESDFIPIRKRTEQAPKQIDLLAAIFTVNRAAKRYRDAASSCYTHKIHGFARANKRKKEDLYLLKDKGIKVAYTAGLLACEGKQGSSYIYQGNGYCFHSYLKPKDLDLATIIEISPEEVRVESKVKTEKYRLKDAIYTLDVLNTINIDQDFVLEKPDFFSKNKGSKYEYSNYDRQNEENHDNWDDDWDDDWGDQD